MRIKSIRGTKDILPGESDIWRGVEETIRRVLISYQFAEIRTPIFEETELFARGIGQLTDIVSKEMYTFQDRSKKSVTLRPEVTAPVVRAFIEHNMAEARPQTKLFYIGPAFRQERPQAGRLRQFHQFGAEILGSPRPEADVEIIAACVDCYRALDILDANLKLNTVGCQNCRPGYKERLREFLEGLRDGLCEDCNGRIEKNPLRVLDCKKESCRQATENAPRIDDHLCETCATHFTRTRSLLERMGIEYEVDFRLVRGLDYYTRTAFEVVSRGLGAQDALGGGGRYDLLCEELGGRPTPSVGFASGIERLMMVLPEEAKPQARGLDVYLVALGEEAAAWALVKAAELRSSGVSVQQDLLGRSLKAQMRDANRNGARFVVIAGDRELESGQFQMKDMQASQQSEVAEAALLDEIKRKLA